MWIGIKCFSCQSAQIDWMSWNQIWPFLLLENWCLSPLICFRLSASHLHWHNDGTFESSWYNDYYFILKWNKEKKDWNIWILGTLQQIWQYSLKRIHFRSCKCEILKVFGKSSQWFKVSYWLNLYPSLFLFILNIVLDLTKNELIILI